MQFASPLPLWLAVLAAAAVAAAAFLAYRAPLVPLSPLQRAALIGLRALSLGVLVVFLSRPMVLIPAASDPGAVVPVLVDVSRSMRVEDADGQSRIAQASGLLERALLPSLASRFTPELYAVGDGVAPASLDALAAGARRSDLSSAL